MPQNYEEMTVPELKDLAEKRGVEVFSDARKAEIISALEASDTLLKPEAREGEIPPEGEIEPPPEGEENPRPDEPTKPYQMSSTVNIEIAPEDFARIKLSN